MGWWKKIIYFLSWISRLISCNFPSQTFESRTVWKCTFPCCWKNLLKLKTLGMQLAQLEVKEFLKKCLFLTMCLVPFMPSIQRATFPKINLEILVSLLDVLSTLTSPCQTIFDSQKKKCIVIKFLLAAIATPVIRQLFKSLKWPKWKLSSFKYNVYLFLNFILLVDSFFFQDTFFFTNNWNSILWSYPQFISF